MRERDLGLTFLFSVKMFDWWRKLKKKKKIPTANELKSLWLSGEKKFFFLNKIYRNWLCAMFVLRIKVKNQIIKYDGIISISHGRRTHMKRAILSFSSPTPPTRSRTVQFQDSPFGSLTARRFQKILSRAKEEPHTHVQLLRKTIQQEPLSFSFFRFRS
jgi:hypothetical protein